jgi:hypothetical protein
VKKSSKLCILITALSLAAIPCVLLGESVLYGFGFTLSYPYIDALFPSADTSFRLSFTIYLWMLVGGSVLTSALVWIRRSWAALAGCVVSLSSLVCHVVRSVLDGYSVFQIDDVWRFFMLALPLAAAIACIILFLAIRQERNNEKM